MEEKDWVMEQEEALSNFRRDAELATSMFTELMNLAGRFVKENPRPFDYEEEADDILRVAEMMLRIVEINQRR